MKHTFLDKIMTIISAALLAAATVCLIINWGNVPQQIPTHYNFAGEPDAYGGKNALIWELGLAWGMLLLFLVVEKFPRLWNFPVELTVQNRDRLMRIARTMMGIIKLLIAGLFSVIIIAAVMAKDLGAWVVIVFLAAITGTTLISILLMFKHK